MMKTLMKTLLPLILLVSATDLIHAQRDGGIQASLRAAVEAGEISQEQAEAMTSAMRKTAPKKDEKVGRRLREAVAAGDLTEEQARAMYKTYDSTKKAPRAGRKKDSNQKPRGEKMAAAQKRMQQTPDSNQARGERSRGDKGQERAPRAERKKDSNKKPRGEERMAIFRERLVEAVKSGKMTRAEAGEKMAAAQKRMQQNSDGDQARDERPQGERGQDRSKLIERKKNAGKRAPRAERQQDGDNDSRGNERMTMLRESLGEAVKSGEMTRAEAGEKWAAAEKRMQKKMGSDQARGERPQGERGQDRSKLIERKKNAGKKEGKKSTCENCGAQKQRQ